MKFRNMSATPFVHVIAGILILAFPEILAVLVGVYLIVIGILGFIERR